MSQNKALEERAFTLHLWAKKLITESRLASEDRKAEIEGELKTTLREFSSQVLHTEAYVPRLLASTCEEALGAIQDNRSMDYATIRADDPRIVDAYQHLERTFTPPSSPGPGMDNALPNASGEGQTIGLPPPASDTPKKTITVKRTLMTSGKRTVNEALMGRVKAPSSGVGSGVGAGAGMGAGTTAGADVGTSAGASVGAGAGTTVGVDVRTTSGASVGTGVGTSAGTGIGASVGTGAGASAGMGVGTGVEAGIRMGAASGVALRSGEGSGSGERVKKRKVDRADEKERKKRRAISASMLEETEDEAGELPDMSSSSKSDRKLKPGMEKNERTEKRKDKGKGKEIERTEKGKGKAVERTEKGKGKAVERTEKGKGKAVERAEKGKGKAVEKTEKEERGRKRQVVELDVESDGGEVRKKKKSKGKSAERVQVKEETDDGESRKDPPCSCCANSASNRTCVQLAPGTACTECKRLKMKCELVDKAIAPPRRGRAKTPMPPSSSRGKKTGQRESSAATTTTTTAKASKTASKAKPKPSPQPDKVAQTGKGSSGTTSSSKAGPSRLIPEVVLTERKSRKEMMRVAPPSTSGRQTPTFSELNRSSTPEAAPVPVETLALLVEKITRLENGFNALVGSNEAIRRHLIRPRVDRATSPPPARTPSPDIKPVSKLEKLEPDISDVKPGPTSGSLIDPITILAGVQGNRPFTTPVPIVESTPEVERPYVTPAPTSGTTDRYFKEYIDPSALASPSQRITPVSPSLRRRQTAPSTPDRTSSSPLLDQKPLPPSPLPDQQPPPCVSDGPPPPGLPDQQRPSPMPDRISQTIVLDNPSPPIKRDLMGAGEDKGDQEK